jgi:Flp pilus assembly protein TadD
MAFKEPQNKADPLTESLAFIARREYEQAVIVLEEYLLDNPDQSDMRILLMRCQIAAGKTAEAVATADNILRNDGNNHLAAGEAWLIKGETGKALASFEQGLREHPRRKEYLFLKALAAYKEGFIEQAGQNLQQALSDDFEWEEETLLDAMVHHLLASREFMDFENLYLDAEERVVESNDAPQNRWFALNMPIYDLMTSPEARQKEHAQKIALYLNTQLGRDDFRHGVEHLESILKDFAANQDDARFGLEAFKLLGEKKLDHLAALILGLLLEHLKDFSPYFGLSADYISGSQLQQVILTLPLSIATSILLLYGLSNPEQGQSAMTAIPVNPDVAATLIALAFQAFYREIDRYRRSG